MSLFRWEDSSAWFVLSVGPVASSSFTDCSSSLRFRASSIGRLQLPLIDVSSFVYRFKLNFVSGLRSSASTLNKTILEPARPVQFSYLVHCLERLPLVVANAGDVFRLIAASSSTTTINKSAADSVAKISSYWADAEVSTWLKWRIILNAAKPETSHAIISRDGCGSARSIQPL